VSGASQPASGADRAIRVSTAAAVLGVAVIAAYLSYEHAYAVVRAHGETGLTARLEPATIDGLVYSSSMVILYAARHRLPVPALARCLLALGIAATLAANVAHGCPMALSEQSSLPGPPPASSAATNSSSGSSALTRTAGWPTNQRRTSRSDQRLIPAQSCGLSQRPLATARPPTWE
jgi:Protein of unknown function (DUF2637)